MDDGRQRIGDDPFVAPVDQRDPAKRLRGRLAAPVTIWTTYDGSGVPVGVTISSVIVVDGDRPSVVAIVQPLSEFWEAVGESGRFVLHVVDSGAQRVADTFAGRYPGADSSFPPDTIASEWGPVLGRFPTRAYCTLAGVLLEGQPLVVRGLIDRLAVDEDAERPLVHYRGRYFGLRRPD